MGLFRIDSALPQPFPRQGQTGGDPVLAAGTDGQLLATLGSVADSTTGIALAGIATVRLAYEIVGCSAKIMGASSVAN